METEAHDTHVTAHADEGLTARCSIELLHALAARTRYHSWDSIEELLQLPQDAHKAVRGQKPDRRSGYPRLFVKDTYFDALDTVAMEYPSAPDALDAVRGFWETTGVRIPEIDDLFAQIYSASPAERRSGERGDAWWETLKDALYANFSYDNGQANQKTPIGRPTRAVAHATPAEAAVPTPPAPCAAPGAASEHDAPTAAPYPSLLDGFCACVATEFSRPATAPIDAAELLRRVMPCEFEPSLAATLHLSVPRFAAAAGTSQAAAFVFEFFAHDQGVRLSQLVQRCRTLCAYTSEPAFFRQADALLAAQEQNGCPTPSVAAARSGFARFADGDVARGAAYLLLIALLGVQNHHLAHRIVATAPPTRR